MKRISKKLKKAIKDIEEFTGFECLHIANLFASGRDVSTDEIHDALDAESNYHEMRLSDLQTCIDAAKRAAE